MAFTSAFIVFVKGPQNEEQRQTIEMPFLSLDNVIQGTRLMRLTSSVIPPRDALMSLFFYFAFPLFFLQVSLKLGTHMKSFRGACLCKRKDPFFGENKTRVEILLLQRLHYWHTVYRENLAIIYEEEQKVSPSFSMALWRLLHVWHSSIVLKQTTHKNTLAMSNASPNFHLRLTGGLYNDY